MKEPPASSSSAESVRETLPYLSNADAKKDFGMPTPLPSEKDVKKANDDLAGIESDVKAVQKSAFEAVKHAMAGVGAGLFATGVTHPVDVVKTRFQVQDGHYRQKTYMSTFNALQTIAQKEGVRGFYKGLTPSLVGSAVAWGSYFQSYNIAKGYLRSHYGKDKALGAADHLLSGCFAGLVTVFITNPIWVIKTRMQIDTQTGGGARRFRDAITSLVRDEGLRGMYKGLPMSIFAVSHGAIQFTAYEEINSHLKSVLQQDLGSHHHAFAAFASKVVAAVSTYPFQVVRSRLQQQSPAEPSKYKNNMDVIQKTIKYEGFSGFYRGFGPNLVRVVPTSILTFVSYEWLIAQLNKIV